MSAGTDSGAARQDGTSGLGALGTEARDAARALAAAPSGIREAALRGAADGIEAGSEELLAANQLDLQAAERARAPSARVDRLRLTPARLASMARALRELSSQPDPVGRVLDGWVRPNGLRVRRVRVPLGVVGVIYENRPNVTSDAFGLSLRSGNAVLLRGSSEAQHSNRAIVAVLRRSLGDAGLPAGGVGLVDDVSREGAAAFMRARGVIDCLVPRGGASLLAAVEANATVPVVLDGAGNCHIYIDESADLDAAVAIVADAKCSRPAVCNAVETVLVHAGVAERALPLLQRELGGVELRADRRAARHLPSSTPATDADFATEFLDLVLAVGVVDDIDAAIAHVGRYGTGHSEAIVTSDVRAAQRWISEVDAAAVLVNASTRFVDGGELGFGAEIGISTQKLHVRGPMGAEALTCIKLVVEGDGHTRG